VSTGEDKMSAGDYALPAAEYDLFGSNRSDSLSDEADVLPVFEHDVSAAANRLCRAADAVPDGQDAVSDSDNLLSADDDEVSACVHEVSAHADEVSARDDELSGQANEVSASGYHLSDRYQFGGDTVSGDADALSA